PEGATPRRPKQQISSSWLVERLSSSRVGGASCQVNTPARVDPEEPPSARRAGDCFCRAGRSALPSTPRCLGHPKQPRGQSLRWLVVFNEKGGRWARSESMPSLGTAS